jgi:hypothetical protein
MLSNNRQISTLVIVLIGDFNPVIIQPFWLLAKRLIKEEEANNATVEVIHNELVKFQIDWFMVQITRDRFEIRTNQEPYFEPLRDLAISIFEILRETPIRALGLNHIRHYILEQKEYRELGNTLAPFDNWAIFKRPELLTLEMLEKDDKGNYVRVRVQPSDTIKQSFSLMVNVNDHISVSEDGIRKASGSVGQVLSGRWKDSFLIADTIESNIDKVIKR